MHLHDVTQTLRFGAPLAKAHGVVILLHGRGSNPEDISSLAGYFRSSPHARDLAFVAPSATHDTWYPQRFFVPLAQNEPSLSSALDVIGQLVSEARAAGISYERIAIAGFSQGACLSLEYAARHPQRYAFVAALSGALIGPISTPREAVDLLRTPVLLGCAERDAHIPLQHVEHSAAAFAAFNADVTTQIFPGSAHTVFPDEAAWLARQFA